jgi:biofilm PGA synthesis N-glycosyltransferase PgaC
LYIPVKVKYAGALIFSLSWAGFSIWVSQPWYEDLSNEIGVALAYFLISFIAIIPGFMNAFVFASLLVDRRPKIRTDLTYPPVTVNGCV